MPRKKREPIEGENIREDAKPVENTKKLSIVVSIFTYNRILSALQRDRNYRKKGINFLDDAIENELIRSETKAYSRPIGEDRRKIDSEVEKEAQIISPSLQGALNNSKLQDESSKQAEEKF